MTTAPSQPPGLLRRVLGMIWSPQPTLTDALTHQVWIGMLVVTILVPAAGGSLLLSTGVGQRALVERQVQSMVDVGAEVTDEQYERFTGFTRYAAVFQFASLAVTVPLITVIVAALLFVISSGFLGGLATFKQIYTVVVHAGVVFIVQALFVGPMNYVRAEMASPTTLAAFAPMLERDTFAIRFLGVIDLFFIWWIVLLAMGTAVATRGKTQSIAVGLLALYVGAAVGIAFVMTQLAAS